MPPQESAMLATFLLAFALPFLLLNGQTGATGLLLGRQSEKPCDFDCIHGRCDFRTRTCVCLPGWLGAGCDLCALGMACQAAEPRLALILPQAGPINGSASPAFVYAHGNGLPRGQNGVYSCVFGSAESSPGQWLSSSLVRCPLPQSAQEPAKLAFSLVPAGSNAFIPYQEEWGTSHFTYFAPCRTDQCHGQCLGPLCLCPHSRGGPLCEQANLTLNGTRPQEVRLNGTSAVEFRPYLAKLAIQNDADARLSVDSDIDGLQLDPLEGVLFWPSPLGRSRSYSIRVAVDHPLDGARQRMNWTLHVPPSYAAHMERALALANGTNGRELRGKVQWGAGGEGGGEKPALNGSLPLLVHISATDSARPSPIEDIPIWSDPDQQFRHTLYPYLGGADKIAITVRHPGSDLEQHLHERDLHDETDALEWTQERVEVGKESGGGEEMVAVDNLLMAANGTEGGDGTLLALNYSLRLAPLDGDCLAGWRFEVVEPRDLLAIDQAAFESNGRRVQLRLRPLIELAKMRQNAGGAGLPLRLAFICMPTGQSAIVRQTLTGLAHPRQQRPLTSSAELSPKRLYVDPANPAVLSLDIRLPPAAGHQLLQRANLESASFAPFNLVWLSRPAAGIWRLWLAPKSGELERQDGGAVDGALLIQGAENLALSVPYHIQPIPQPDQSTFLFTLTIKHSANLQPVSMESPQSATDWHVDVELYSQAREQQFVRTLLLNTPDQFGPLQADLFQLRVRSRHFLPFSTLLHIDPLDNAFIVELEARPSQYFAFDGQNFHSEWEEREGISQPTIEFRPAVFATKQNNGGGQQQQQFVDVIYADGPARSFATVPEEWAKKGSASRLSLPMASLDSALCLGCGFRQLVQFHAATPPMPSAECSALALKVPFLASLPVGSSPAQLQFHQHFLLTSIEEGAAPKEEAEESKVPPKICVADRVSSPPPQLALRTSIHRNCPLARLRLCRALFASPGPRCQQWWRQLPDDLLSVHSLAQFVLLSADCRREGSGPGAMLELVECIGRVDKQCPLHPLEAEMAPHDGAQLFNQIGYLKPFRSGLESLFPALGLVESQLVNFPSLLADFIRQLNALFPPSMMAPFVASSKFYDQFVAAIGTQSPNGTTVEWAELDALLGDNRQSGHELVHRWNWLVRLLEGDRLDLLEAGTEANAGVEQIRELVKSADRLKTVTRQFGADNPFAMFRDVLRRIFGTVAFHQERLNETTAEGDAEEEVVAWADVRVEPGEPVEGEEFRVFANVRTRKHHLLADMTAIRLDLRFGQPSPVKFRVGPVFNSGPAPLGQSTLGPGQRLLVDWTVLPVPEFRLTEPVRQELDLTLSFELGGQRKAQRLRAPPILVRPRPSVRLLAFAHPTLDGGGGPSAPFSLLLSAINSGYAPLAQVQLHQLRLQLAPADPVDTRPMDFRIVATRLEPAEEGHEEQGQSLAFGPIPSGAASHLALNISVEAAGRMNKVALFRNLSALVSVNGALLPPGQFDQRFFLIQDTARRDHSLLVVSEHSSPLPLYLFAKRDSALTPLTTLQLIEEKEARPLLNGHPFLSRAFALRRLSLQPTPSANNSSALLATLSVDTAQTFGDGAKLLRVAEVGAQGRQRPLDMALVWIGQTSNEKTTLINFVDVGASPAVPQLIYELLFGRPDHFRAPFFPQPLYQLHLASPVVPIGQRVLARMQAISPSSRPLNYSLWTQTETSPFSVVPSTGDLVLSHPLSAQAEYCLNLAASDSEGHTARVPVQISVLGIESPAGSACQLFPADGPSSRLYSHEFRPAEEGKEGEGIELVDIITLAPANDGEGKGTTNRPLTTTGIILEELGGDSTLAPVSTTPGALATADEDERGMSYEIGNGTEPEGMVLTSTEATEGPPSMPAFGGMGGAGIGFQTPLVRFATVQRTTASIQPGIFPSSPTGVPIQIAGGPVMGGGPNAYRPRPGQQRKTGGGSLAGIQREGKGGDMTSAGATAMAEMACRLRATKPIWALICDMAKTVYRTTLQNA